MWKTLPKSQFPDVSQGTTSRTSRAFQGQQFGLRCYSPLRADHTKNQRVILAPTSSVSLFYSGPNPSDWLLTTSCTCPLHSRGHRFWHGLHISSQRHYSDSSPASLPLLHSVLTGSSLPYCCKVFILSPSIWTTT